MVAQVVPVVAGGLYEGVKVLYRIGADANAFVNQHIQELKASTEVRVARTGRVLEQAKTGFGYGYAAPVLIIATGQLMLGNPLLAGKTVGSAVILTNPLAMTCAAVGAIYFGWSALSKQEQEELIQTLSDGLNLGIEFIRSVIQFVVDQTKKLFNKKELEAFKAVVLAAHQQVKSYLAPVIDSVGKGTDRAIDATAQSLNDAVSKAKQYWKSLKPAVQPGQKQIVGVQGLQDDPSG